MAVVILTVVLVIFYSTTTTTTTAAAVPYEGVCVYTVLFCEFVAIFLLWSVRRPVLWIETCWDSSVLGLIVLECLWCVIVITTVSWTAHSWLHWGWRIHLQTCLEKSISVLIYACVLYAVLVLPITNKNASIRWQDSARRQYQAGLRGDVGLWLMATWKARFRLHVCCN